MAVFRVERNRGYTVMSNHHLRNKELSLKAKRLLSQMLSLHESKDSIEHNLLPFIPDECDYRGMFFCPGQIPDSVMDAVQTALDENPENQRAKIMLEAFQHSMNHPDTDDLRELRRFIQESGI